MSKKIIISESQLNAIITRGVNGVLNEGDLKEYEMGDESESYYDNKSDELMVAVNVDSRECCAADLQGYPDGDGTYILFSCSGERNNSRDPQESDWDWADANVEGVVYCDEDSCSEPSYEDLSRYDNIIDELKQEALKYFQRSSWL